MKKDLLWQIFLDTGDPMCWVLYRHAGATGLIDSGAKPGQGEPRGGSAREVKSRRMSGF